MEYVFKARTAKVSPNGKSTGSTSYKPLERGVNYFEWAVYGSKVIFIGILLYLTHLLYWHKAILSEVMDPDHIDFYALLILLLFIGICFDLWGVPGPM